MLRRRAESLTRCLRASGRGMRGGCFYWLSAPVGRVQRSSLAKQGLTHLCPDLDYNRSHWGMQITFLMTRRFAVVLIVLVLALVATLALCGYPPRDSYRQPPTWVR